jgi:hypothetical protein
MLAEIPYLKQRLMADYEVEQNTKHAPGHLGEKVFETRRFALKQLASRVGAKIERLRCQRQKLREGRQKTGRSCGSGIILPDEICIQSFNLTLAFLA